jgi:hypothetical protein
MKDERMTVDAGATSSPVRGPTTTAMGLGRCSRLRALSDIVVRATIVIAALSAAACSDASDSTTGRRIVLATTMTAPLATEIFDNAMGWSITLQTLVVSTGPLYYFDGATIFSQNDGPANRTYDLLERFIGVRSAHAHPGHYVPGNARGQVLSGTAVDLRSGPVDLVVGDGVTGPVRSATFSFGVTAAEQFADVLGPHIAVIEGTATQGNDVRVFRAEIDADDLLSAKKVPAIEGCPFEPTNMEGDGTVTVALQLPLWFDQVEFDTVPSSNDGRPVLMAKASLARKELVRGMKAGDGYAFSYSKK